MIRRKNMKKVKRRVIILLLIFVAALGITAAMLFREEKKEVVYAEMGEATLPVLFMEFEGQEVNELHGYTKEMDLSYVRDTITQLDTGRNLTVQVHHFGNSIQSLKCYVRSLDGENLIERLDANLNVILSDRVKAEIPFSALLKQNTEYQLVFELKTDKHEAIYYYTRMIYGADMHTAELMEFAGKFSDATFDKEAAKEVVRDYVYNDSEEYNHTFAYTDLHSPLSKITWKEWAPVKGDVNSIDFTEITDSQITMRMNFDMGGYDSRGIYQTYDVDETYCLRWRQGKIYVLDYTRQVNQKFTGDKNVMDNGSIWVGIAGEDQLNAMSDEKSVYTAFTYQNDLWCYNSKENEMIHVFSFGSNTEDALRAEYDQHDVSVIRVDDNGDVCFMVYGYMNRGRHEGQCGIAFYRYSQKENALEELYYIPTEVPFQVLKEDLSRLAYVNDNMLCYILYGNNIYAIDLNGSEAMTVAENVDSDSYMLGAGGEVIVWQNSDSADGTIYFFQLTTGTLTELQPEEGEFLHSIGYIQNDLIYGVGRIDDILMEAGEETMFPCYKLVILDENLTEVENYQISGLYVTGAKIESGRILLDRVRKNESGGYENASSDILILNAGDVNTGVSTIKTSQSEVQYQEHYIALGIKHTDQLVFSGSSPKLMLTGRETETILAASEVRDHMYYVYARGELMGAYGEISDAIRGAYDAMGTVTNASQRILWNRNTRAIYVTLQLPNVEIDPEYSLAAGTTMLLTMAGARDTGSKMQLLGGNSPYEILKDQLGNRAVELYNCSVSQVLYYLNLGSPVLAVTGDQAGLVLYGYETNTVTIYDPANGASQTISTKEADALFAGSGNRFVSYLPED